MAKLVVDSCEDAFDNAEKTLKKLGMMPRHLSKNGKRLFILMLARESNEPGFSERKIQQWTKEGF